MSGADLIAVERQRQQEVEGWTLDHDDEHRNGELVKAARLYTKAALTEPTNRMSWFPSLQRGSCRCSSSKLVLY